MKVQRVNRNEQKFLFVRRIPLKKLLTHCREDKETTGTRETKEK